MKIPCSGVILAGGLNSRFSGKPKGLQKVQGLRILDTIYELFSDLFDDVLLVTNDPTLYLDWDLTVVTDLHGVRCSLTGIHAGLFYAKHPWVFISACDTPFIKQALVQSIIDGIQPGADVVIPRTAKGVEPLCAVYSRRCLNIVERQLAEKRYKIQDVFEKMRVQEISEAYLRQFDPDLVSFFNINTRNDLNLAERLHRNRSDNGYCCVDGKSQKTPGLS